MLARQAGCPRYLRPLLGKIGSGDLDPTFVITDRVEIDGVPDAYERFGNRTDAGIKVVISM